jgi:hypothetical protein
MRDMKGGLLERSGEKFSNRPGSLVMFQPPPLQSDPPIRWIGTPVSPYEIAIPGKTRLLFSDLFRSRNLFLPTVEFGLIKKSSDFKIKSNYESGSGAILKHSNPGKRWGFPNGDLLI